MYKDFFYKKRDNLKDINSNTLKDQQLGAK
jgi:hypothetical protein